MIHGRVRRVFGDRLPFAGAQVEGETRRGWLGGLAVITDSLVVVWAVAAANEIDLIVFLGSASRDAEAGSARMGGQLGPLNFAGILMADLSSPALVRGHKPG